MPAKEAESVTEWYDALSRNYDELYGEEQDKKHAKISQLLRNREFKIIVDVGCGTGKLLELFAPRSELRLGIDISLQMLSRAKQRITNAGIQLVRADASHLPLQDRIVDGATSVSMTESGPVLKEHLKELSRIATEDALLIMTIFGDKDRTSQRQLGEEGIELVEALSDREQLYVVDKTRNRVKPHHQSSALV